MKNIVKIAFVLLFATVAVTACDLPLEPTLDENTVELKLVCADPAVKATEPGADTYNENTLKHIDYFVYASPAGPCLLHQRVASPGETYRVNVGSLVNDGSLTGGGVCYVYVVANWPETFNGDETVAQIRALTVTSTDFDVATAANHRFVMDCKQALQATVSRTGSSVTVNLYRLAAKLTMQVNIPASIVDGSKTYTPSPNSLQIYYLYAKRTAKLDGTPTAYSSSTSFDYPYNRPVSVTAATGDYAYVGTAAPFYTYPRSWQSHEMTAPYFKVVLSWSDGTTAKPYYYKVLLPESMGGQIDRNTLYKFVMNIGVLGSDTDDGTVELEGRYYVVEWKTGTDLGNPGTISRGKYLETASDVYYMYGDTYSITIPVTSSHNITVGNSASRVTGAAWTNYSTSPNPTNYTGATGLGNLSHAPTLSADGRNSITFTHDLVSIAQASNTNKPDVAQISFTVRIQNEAGLYKNITIIQKPSLVIENKKNAGGNTGAVYVNYYVYSHWFWGDQDMNGYTYPYDNSTYLGGVNGINSSGFNSNPNMYVISASVAPEGTIIADPRSSTIGYCGSSNYNWTSPQGYDITSGQQRPLQNYYPTDPGENAKNKIAPQFRIASSYGYILASGGNFLTYEEAQKRCATYQEDGIPAGRWRVPTKAEIEFMIKLANWGVIPPLFQAEAYNDSGYTPNYHEGGYWTADGGVVYPWTNNQIGYLTASEFYTHSHYNTGNAQHAMSTNGVRCVYDEWYWGSAQISNKTRFTWGDKPIN